MKEIKINKYQSTYYFIWDNKDETIKIVNDYLKSTKGDNWSCGRCWDEKTKSNTSDSLYISKKEGTFQTNSFFQVGKYVVDYGNIFYEFDEESFNNKKFTKDWLKNE